MYPVSKLGKSPRAVGKLKEDNMFRKRIIFYTNLFMISILCNACVAYSDRADVQSTHSRYKRSLPSPEEAKVALDKHNEFRAMIGDEGEEPIPSDMRFMTWDDGLALTSLTYAKKCIWKHSHLSERKTAALSTNNGENLWTGFGDLAINFDPAHGITTWFNEYKDYDFYNKTCTPGKKCGHYTQVVWAKSYKLGCAWHLCSTLVAEGDVLKDAMFMVCHYAPGGNVEDEEMYQVGERCSKCLSLDTCPDDRLCHNEKRDKIIPLPSNPGIVAGGLVAVILMLALFGGLGYYVHLKYGISKSKLLLAIRKSRRVSSSVALNENDVTTSTITKADQSTSVSDALSCAADSDRIAAAKTNGTRLSTINIDTASPD
ncbi:unnamed protein product [Clavelina lepadiformis]|uniref:SCP domain-containing protein n=1 Tax=Clavelina lepadiformis TaxID=159417 RepID=A0ABP0FG74_CLALP